MTKEQIKNFILKEMHDEDEGRIVSEVVENMALNLSDLQIREIEAELYRDNMVTIENSRYGKMLHITEKGYEFISKGGYKSVSLKAAEYLASSVEITFSEANSQRKKEDATKIFHQKIQSVFNKLNNRMSVIGGDELEIITAPLLILYKDYYGSSSKSMKCRDLIKDGDKCRKELLPFLAKTLTELELEVRPSDLDIHPKIKGVSEKLFFDGYYKQAVLDAFILVDNEIKEITGSAKSGKELMDETFSEKNPTLKFSDDKGEQKGIMFLYNGSVMAIRNRYAHKSIKITDKKYALDLIHFASGLLRLIENRDIY